MSMFLFNTFSRGTKLVTSIGQNPINADGTIKGEETDDEVNKVHPSIVDIIALGGIGTAVTTLVLTNGHIVDAASYTTMGMAPTAAYQKHKLQKLGGFRGQHNKLRENVNKLQEENNKLSSNISLMEKQVDKLENVENSLEERAKEGQTNVNRLMFIVKENKRIQKQITKILNQQIMQQILEIILKSDKNQDENICKEEIEMLELRLSMMSNSFEFDKYNFRNMLPANWETNGVDVACIMKIIRNLFDDEVEEKDNIFHLCPENMLEDDK